MEIISNEDGYHSIRCEHCERYLSVDIEGEKGDFIRDNDAFRCMFCGGIVAYKGDFEEKRREYAKSKDT